MQTTWAQKPTDTNMSHTRRFIVAGLLPLGLLWGCGGPEVELDEGAPGVQRQAAMQPLKCGSSLSYTVEERFTYPALRYRGHGTTEQEAILDLKRHAVEHVAEAQYFMALPEDATSGWLFYLPDGSQKVVMDPCPGCLDGEKGCDYSVKATYLGAVTASNPECVRFFDVWDCTGEVDFNLDSATPSAEVSCSPCVGEACKTGAVGKVKPVLPTEAEKDELAEKEETAEKVEVFDEE